MDSHAAFAARAGEGVSFPAAQLLVIAVLGATAGVIAAIRPARRAARLPVLRAVAAE